MKKIIIIALSCASFPHIAFFSSKTFAVLLVLTLTAPTGVRGRLMCSLHSASDRKTISSIGNGISGLRAAAFWSSRSLSRITSLLFTRFICCAERKGKTTVSLGFLCLRMEEERIEALLLGDKRDLSFFVPPGDESYCMQEDDETSTAHLSDSFSNVSLQEDERDDASRGEKESYASRLLAFLNEQSCVAGSSASLEDFASKGERVEFFDQGAQVMLAQCVAEATKDYHLLRAELDSIQKRKAKVERKLAEHQLKKVENDVPTRKRVLLRSDDPVTELEQKQAMFESMLHEKRRDLMKVVKDLVQLKAKQPSLKLSGMYCLLSRAIRN